MDRTERAIFEYLTHHGFLNVAYEPDGQVPPDFSVDNRIAVEVTRLDLNVAAPPMRRSLEQDANPLARIILKALASMGPPDADGSWFVTYQFRRPLPAWKLLRRQIPDRLRELIRSGIQHGARYEITHGLSFTFYRAEASFPTRLVFGGFVDGNSGGFVIANIIRNLPLCIHEKARKIAPFRQRYPEWWLAVLDLIGYGRLEESELTALRQVVPVTAPWRRIILVSPSDHTRGVEI